MRRECNFFNATQIIEATYLGSFYMRKTNSNQTNTRTNLHSVWAMQIFNKRKQIPLRPIRKWKTKISETKMLHFKIHLLMVLDGKVGQ